jgi:hypothetical protein
MYKQQFVGSVRPQPAFSGVGMISQEKQEVGAIVGRMKTGKEYTPKPHPRK